MVLCQKKRVHTKEHPEVGDGGARKLTGGGIRGLLVRESVQLRIVGKKIPGDLAVIAITSHATIHTKKEMDFAGYQPCPL